MPGTITAPIQKLTKAELEKTCDDLTRHIGAHVNDFFKQRGLVARQGHSWVTTDSQSFVIFVPFVSRRSS